MDILHKLIRKFVFGELPPNADGWYIWRNSPDWPKDCYKCIEIANGIMIDTIPGDSYGTYEILEECKPYGQFKGPILNR